MFCVSISMWFCLHVDENMPINLKVAITKSNYLLPARVRLGLACKETGPEAKWASDKNRRLSPGGHTQGTVPRGVRLLSSLFAYGVKVGCSLGGCGRPPKCHHLGIQRIIFIVRSKVFWNFQKKKTSRPNTQHFNRASREHGPDSNTKIHLLENIISTVSPNLTPRL